MNLTNATIHEGVLYTQRLTTRDLDLPPQPLNVRLVNGPAGSSLANGVFDWMPSEDQGPSTNEIFVAVSDGMRSTTNSFTIIVIEVNNAPTLAIIPSPAVILEDAGQQTVNLNGISAGEGESQLLTVTATSDNPGLIPNPTVTYTSPNATGSLSYMPLANASGTATITVIVTDSGGTANGGVDAVTNTFTVVVNSVNDAPTLGAISDLTGSGSWTAVSTNGAPVGRSDHTAVWTGSEMIVWGGVANSGFGALNTGARYNRASNTWTPISTNGAPTGRQGHMAVWTGTEMIIWGGSPNSFANCPALNDGARYNPTSDTWASISATDAPGARAGAAMVWAGSEMIVWGGWNWGNGGPQGDGARYNPTSNTWASISSTGAPSARQLSAAVWTGSELIIWGGSDFGHLNSGGRYNLTSNTWTATSASGLAGRNGHSGIWTGSELIVWGGGNGSGVLDDGARYNPAGNSWTAVTTSDAPAARSSHRAVWTGSEMIVWGGNSASVLNTGARYNPTGNSWAATSTNGTLSGRYSHTAVWTGSEMIIWGGYNGSFLNDGALYNPAAILEDAGLQTVNLTGISAGGGESQTLTVTATSSNTGLISSPGITYTSANSTGSISFTPVANASGTATITVIVTDNGGTANGGVDAVTNTFTVIVNPVNDAPVAVADVLASILENSGNRTIGFASLLGNDSTGPLNEGGQSLTITAVANAVGGTATIVGTDVIFSPALNFNGTAGFDYTVQDNGQTGSPLVDDFKSAVGSVSFTVTPVNDAPSFTIVPSGAVAWYKAENNANDSVGGYNGTLQGAATFVSGEVGQAFSFSGGSYVSIPDATALRPSALTVEAWVNIGNSSPAGVIASKYGGTYNGWILEMGSSTTVSFNLYRDSTHNIGAGASIPSATWVHVAGSYDGATVQIYVNGVLQDTQPFTGGYTATTVPMTMGVASWNPAFSPRWLSGAVDELAVFNRALTATEIQAIYAAGPAGKTGLRLVNVAEDSGLHTETGFAAQISAGPMDESGQALNFILSNDNNAMFSEQPAIAADGTLTFTPATDASGSATVTVQLHDDGDTANGGVNTFSRTFTVVVNSVNDAPVAMGDVLTSILEDSGNRTISFTSLLANDSAGPLNESGQSLTITAVANAVGGTATIVGTDVIFSPALNFHGTAGFDYTVQDNGQTGSPLVDDFKSAVGSVSFTVTALNDAPSFTIPAETSGSATTNRYPYTGALTNITLPPGTYDITAYGAQGGSGGGGGGGLGAEMEARFNFTGVTTLTVLVGSAGANSTAGGGGGGSFVVIGSTPLVIAGGGGGAYLVSGGSGGTGTSGGGGSVGRSDGGTGGGGGGGGGGGDTGSGPAGCGNGKGGGGGGGFSGTGGTGSGGGGSGFLDGGAGGVNGGYGGSGGFGGGGGGGYSCGLSGGGGGGGGYSGGGGGFDYGAGGGGGSFINSSALQIGAELAGVQSGNGEIIIVALAGETLAPTNVVVLEDSGPFTQANFATNMLAGPADEQLVQTVSFTVANNNVGLFTADGQPAISPAGTLTFTPVLNANGSATVTVYAQDTGGTLNGGVDTSAAQTFTVTVVAVNDAPTDIALSSTNVAENAAIGTSVGNFTTTDVETPETAGITLVSGSGGEDNAELQYQRHRAPDCRRVRLRDQEHLPHSRAGHGCGRTLF